jgi:hypothetical protein
MVVKIQVVDLWDELAEFGAGNRLESGLFFS